MSGEAPQLGRTLEREDQDFERAHFSALVSLWQHHNTIQFQWFAIVNGAVLLLFVQTFPKFLNRAPCGGKCNLEVGIPFLFASLAVLVVFYVMFRGRKVMKAIEERIAEIERGHSRPDRGYGTIIRPAGLSGTRLMWFFIGLYWLALLLAGLLALSLL